MLGQMWRAENTYRGGKEKQGGLDHCLETAERGLRRGRWEKLLPKKKMSVTVPTSLKKVERLVWGSARIAI